MATAKSEFDFSRRLLSRAILHAVNSWPERQRRIFIQAHYAGKSVAEISHEFGTTPHEISRTLQDLEHKLREALKIFRDADAIEPPCSRYEDFGRRSACCGR